MKLAIFQESYKISILKNDIDLSEVLAGYCQVNIPDQFNNPDYLDVDAVSLVNDDVINDIYAVEEMDIWAYFNLPLSCQFDDGKVILTSLKDSDGESHFVLMLITTTNIPSIYSDSKQFFKLLKNKHAYKYNQIFENFGTPAEELACIA